MTNAKKAVRLVDEVVAATQNVYSVLRTGGFSSAAYIAAVDQREKAIDDLKTVIESLAEAKASA